MGKQIIYGNWWIIETNEGIDVIPADLVGTNLGDLAETCRDFISGRFVSAELLRGYGARLSMPGYLDCTPWSFHETEKEASEFLAAMYDDQDSVEEWAN